MGGIVLVGRQAVTLEEVCDALDALAHEPERSGDLGDGERLVLDRRKDLPPRARLTGRLCQLVTDGRKKAVQLEDPDDEATDGVASRRPLRPVMGSRHDSILSCVSDAGKTGGVAAENENCFSSISLDRPQRIAEHAHAGGAAIGVLREPAERQSEFPGEVQLIWCKDLPVAGHSAPTA